MSEARSEPQPVAGGGEELASRLRRARLNGLFDPSLALQLPDDNERIDQLLDAIEAHLQLHQGHD